MDAVSLFENNLVVMGLLALLCAVILLFVVLAPLKLYSMDKTLKYLLYEMKMTNKMIRETLQAKAAPAAPAKEKPAADTAPKSGAAAQPPAGK